EEIAIEMRLPASQPDRPREQLFSTFSLVRSTGGLGGLAPPAGCGAGVLTSAFTCSPAGWFSAADLSLISLIGSDGCVLFATCFSKCVCCWLNPYSAPARAASARITYYCDR